MHNNYFFLRQLSKQLNGELSGFRIFEIFSQAKDELILILSNGESVKYIKAHLSPHFCCLSFPEKFSRAKKNSVDLFSDLVDLEIKTVEQIENDRSFYFQFEKGFQLLFKMHGNRSNIILFKEGQNTEVFNKHLKQDHVLKISDLARKLLLDEKALKTHDFDYKKAIPVLGKAFEPYFSQKKYDQLNENKKVAVIHELMDYLQNPGFYIHYKSNDLPQLLLFQMDENDKKLTNAKEAVNEFFVNYTKSYYLERKKGVIRNELKSQIKKANAYIIKTSIKLEQLEKGSNYQSLGDVIMANLHQIAPYQKEVELMDFYSNQMITIPLKSNLSPQLNAERYYRKAKNQQLEIKTLSNNIVSKKKHRDQLMEQLEELETATSIKNISKKKKQEQSLPAPFYHTHTFMDYEILIGKNANRNDQLTFQLARKDDLFLHAKDTPGSHVIVRKKTNQGIPMPVIERAASLAAFFSKNKNEGLSRVLYTERKYVRKAKGGPAGTVIVNREKVILAKPEKFPFKK